MRPYIRRLLGLVQFSKDRIQCCNHKPVKALSLFDPLDLRWYLVNWELGDFLCTVQVMYASPPLPSPIKRIFYMSSEGTNFLHEVWAHLFAADLQCPISVCHFRP